MLVFQKDNFFERAAKTTGNFWSDNETIGG